MIFMNLWSSVTKASQALILASQSISPGVKFVDFDAHATIEEFDNTDLLGPYGLGLIEHEQEVHVTFGIGVLAYNDTNLFRMRQMIATIHDALRPQKQIPYYNATTAAIAGYLLMTDGTTVSPMSRAEARPWQFVQASALLEPLAAL